MAGMLTLKNALSSAALASQDGVLVGLRVTLMFGLAAPMQGPTSVPAPRRNSTPVSCHVGTSQTHETLMFLSSRGALLDAEVVVDGVVGELIAHANAG